MTAPQEKPRYFYRDPLAAAWMFKHFGMRFEGNPGIPLQALTGQTFDSENGWSPLFLDASSQQLLEPQIGDVVINCDGVPALVGRNQALSDIYKQYRISLREAMQWVGTAATIIQRNGVPFMWPESEAA